MPRRRDRARRSPAEWGVRVGLAATAAALGYVGIAFSFAQVVENGNPTRAHALASYDGRLTAKLAERQFGRVQALGRQSEPARLAQLALRQDPTAIAAVATLGLQAQARGDIAGARRLFAYSNVLSRRDLQTHLWAIEDAVSRGDVPQALRQYDMALRTAKTAPDVLYPILGSAISDATVRTNLVATLARQPVWATGFVAYVAANGPDPQATARLLLGLRRAGVALSSEATTAAIIGLVGTGAFDDAWRFYAAMRPGTDRRSARDPRFVADLSSPSLFDWQPVNDASIAASIQRGPRGGVLDFAAPPGSGGVVIQQLQMLPPGSYRIEGHGTGIEQPEGSRPYWTLVCRGGAELGRVTLPNSAQAGGSFAGRFDVPAQCPIQTLALVARPSDDIAGVSGQIDHVRLVPAP